MQNNSPICFREARPKPFLLYMDMSVIDYDSLRRYRIRMKNYRPGHVWEELEDEEFLYRLGAAGRSEDGKLHPTAAGRAPLRSLRWQ